MLYYSNIKKYFVLLLHLLLVVSMALLLAFAGMIYWLSSQSGQAFVQDQIENQLSENLGYKIKVQGISFYFPLVAKIKQVSLLDTHGVWLKTNDINISFLPTLNMQNHIIFHKITANKVALLRIPEINISSYDGTGNLDISISKINIAELFIANSVMQLEEDFISSFKGSVHWLSSLKKAIFEVELSINKSIFGFQRISLNSSGFFLLNKNLITITSMTLFSPNFNVYGNGVLNTSTKTLIAKLNTDKIDVSTWRRNISGKIQAEAIISGTIQNPIIKTTVNSYDMIYIEKIIPDTITNITSKKDGEKWAGDINITLSKHHKATMQYKWFDKILKLDNILGNYGSNSLQGALLIDSKNAIMEGRLYTEIPSIEVFHQYIPNSFYGSMRISVQLSSRKNRQVQAASVNLDFKNMELEQVKASSVQTQIEFDDLWNTIPNFVKITSSNISFNDIFINKISFISLRNNKKWTIKLNAGGGSLKKFHMSTAGDLNFISKNNWYLELSSLQGYYQNILFNSKTKIITQKKEDNFIFSIPDLAIGKGKYSIDLKKRNEKISTIFKGKDIYLPELLTSKSKILKRSKANINLNINGDIQSPKLVLQIDLINLYLNSFSKLSHIKSHAILHNGKTIINAKIIENSKVTSRIDLNLPTSLSLKPLKLSLNKTAPIKGNVYMALNSSKLLELFLSPDHIVKGNLKSKIKISGSLNSPLFFGNISLKNGSYNYLPIQININKINFLVNLNNKSMNLVNFHAEDVKGNKIISQGEFIFTNLNKYKYSFNFITKKFEFLNHPIVQGIISGNIQVTGNDRAGKISGILQSNLIEIHLPDRIIQNIPELNIVSIISNSPLQPNKLRFLHKPYIITFDIGIKADRKVFVRGWGLDVELQGNLSLSGNTSEPKISGKLQSIRGRYEEFGKQFYLKQAELLFEGKIPPSPFLSIIGTTTQSDIEIKIIMTGSVERPLLKIESTPIMPQEDALSVLLFGKTATKITLVQAVQLARSLKKLLGKSGDTIDPLGEIKNILGVDSINVTNSADNYDTLVNAGKYIGDKIYLEIEKGTKTGSEKAQVKIEISPHIYLESGTSTTNDSNLGINWKYEY